MIRTILGKDGKNDVTKFAGNSANSGEMVLTSGPQPLVILREDRVTKSRSGCGQPDGPPQIRRTAFGNFLPGAHELAGLRDTDIQSSESHQFARSAETVDIPDLAQYDGAQGIANTGDGSDKATGLFQ